jgi:predicted dehydrogenase
MVETKKIRYAVVGLGWIAQDVILPAFAKARENSELTALVSDDKTKLKKLGEMYGVAGRYSYDEYELCLHSGTVDAVFIALPNALHREYTMRAAKAGIHVLCEKPMAIKEEDCVKMIQACRSNKVKLMIAYRLHFEEGNLRAINIARSGKLGDVRIFNSTFTMDVKGGNVRLSDKLTGGTLYDIGIYCINAARGIFRDEPVEVSAFVSKNRDKRFAGVDEMTSAVMRFPDNRLANFVCSFGAASTSAYEIIGTKGTLRVDPAFSHTGEVKHTLEIGEQKKQTVFPPRDQFAPEIVYFSNCILDNEDPEPSGVEGQADVAIIEAIYRSARLGRAVGIREFKKRKRPSLRQEIRRHDGVPRPALVHAQGPHKR